MLKKSMLLCVVFVFMTGLLWANGGIEGDGNPGKIHLSKKKEYDISGFSLRADYGNINGAKVIAADIGLKGIYKKGTPFPVTGAGWGLFRIKKVSDGVTVTHKLVTGQGTSHGVLHPIFNLDLYVDDRGKIKPIEDYKVTVTVSVSYKILESFNTVMPGNEQYIFVFDDDLDTWILIDDPASGITNVKRFSDHIEFEIIKWPVNDRMFSSGP